MWENVSHDQKFAKVIHWPFGLSLLFKTHKMSSLSWRNPYILIEAGRMKKGTWGRMWLGKGNSCEACNLSMVNQQSEHTETLMRGFNSGFNCTAADADVIWQLNHTEISLCGALREWAAVSLTLWRVIWEKDKIIFLQVWHQNQREVAVKQPRCIHNI